MIHGYIMVVYWNLTGLYGIYIYIYNIEYTVYIYIDIYNHQSDMKLDNDSCLILEY